MTPPLLAPPLLAVDIGNTAIKAGLFSPHPAAGGEDPGSLWIVELETSALDFSPVAAKLPPVVRWAVSSVNRPAERRLAEWVRRHRPNDSYRLLDYHDVPLRIDVDFPERVGFDRLATAVAAYRLRAYDEPVIVVDVGTALKVHVVSVAGAFLGGTISPGLKLSARTLAGETDLLPFVPVTTNAAPPPVIGKNTEAAIRAGLYWGLVGAVRETVARICRERGIDPEVFVTGGDARGLAQELGNRARYVPDLCLSGVAFIMKEA